MNFEQPTTILSPKNFNDIGVISGMHTAD